MFLSTVGRYLRFVAAQTAINYSAAMQFRLSLLMILSCSVAFEVAMLYLQVLLFALYPRVNGWTIQDHTLLYAIMWGAIDGVFLMAYGLFDIVRVATDGRLDAYLLYPIHPLCMILTSKIRVSSVGTWFAVLIFLKWAGITTASKIALYSVVTLLAAVIFVAFTIIIQGLSFYVRIGAGFPRQMMLCLYTVSLAPPVHRGLLLIITKTIIPSFFIAVLPVQIVKCFSWTDLGLLAVVAVGMMSGAIWLFNRGLQRYESGSSVG